MQIQMVAEVTGIVCEFVVPTHTPPGQRTSLRHPFYTNSQVISISPCPRGAKVSNVVGDKSAKKVQMSGKKPMCRLIQLRHSPRSFAPQVGHSSTTCA